MGLKRGDTRINAGTFDQPVNLYHITQTQDTAGGIVRLPQVAAGKIVGSPTPAFSTWASIQPYGGMELRDALRTVGEIWAVFSIRYAVSQLVAESDLIEQKTTGDVYEVRGVEHIDTGRKKVELTCRLVN